MKETKIQIEYDADQKTLQKRVKNKKSGRLEYVKTTPKHPKCWLVVTTKNHRTFSPGDWITESQLKTLINTKGIDIEIGLPGQYRVNHRGY